MLITETGRRRGPLLVLAMAFALAACGGSSAASDTPSVAPSASAPEGSTDPGAPDEDVTLTVAFPTDPQSFNGVIHNFSYTAQVGVQIYNRLLAYDPDYNLVGDLAESWEVSEDGTVWSFQLRDDVVWHDGEPFTSADVEFHYGELLSEWGTSPAAIAVRALESIDTPDDYSITFTFSQPTHVDAFVDLYADTFILPRHVFADGDFENHPANLAPVGTGPFKFVEYEQNVSIVLEANDEYYGGRSEIDRLIFRIIAEPAAAVLALRSGEVDVIEMSHSIPPAEVPNLQEDPNLEVDPIPYYTTGWLAFSSRPEAIEANPWLADEDVRRAIAMAIDRDFLVERVLNNVTNKVETVVSDTIPWAHNPDVVSTEYNPDEAERLLDEAGWPRQDNGVRFTARMPVPIITGLSDAGDAMIEMLRNVGIELQVEQTELSAYLETYLRHEEGLRDFPMTVISGATGPNPVVIRTWYDSNRTPADDPPGFNMYWYENAEVDRLLEEAASIVDQEAAAPVFKEIQALIAADSYIYPLFNRYHIEAWNTKFSGFAEIHRPLAWFASYANITPTR